jgi:arylsulfatase
VIHWPARIKAKGAVRSQFTHVTDIAPTVLEAAGLPFPKSVNGTEQRPFDGTSMVYSFDDATARETHTTQYFEMFGNRGIYSNGWVACTRHSIPWLLAQNPPLAQDVWELYDMTKDFSQAHDLAKKNPAKLKEMQDLFMQEAEKNHVLPIDDRRAERFNPAIAGRPDLMGGRTSLTVYTGMTGIGENAFVNVKNCAYTITAPVVLENASTNGVIIAQAGSFGGWTLYMKDGRIHHEYNYFGIERTNIGGQSALAAGKHIIRYEFAPDSRQPGAGGKCALYVDDQKVAEGRIPKTEPFIFSADEGVDVALDGETPVSNDYKAIDNKFTGTILKVTIDVKPTDLSAEDQKKVDDARAAADEAQE